MEEYISKQKLKESIASVLSDSCCPAFVAATIEQYIDSEPPEDVISVVHGKWEWFEENCGNPYDGIDTNWGRCCSECKEKLGDEYDDPDQEPDFDYCPHCGANMDLEG